jgi:predicted ATPase
LGQRLPLLTRSARDVPARQQTLRKTIQWSYDLLSTLEQRVFRLLSIFVSGCTLHAIEAIAVARANLGEKAFATAWTEGRSMTLEQVLSELE